MLGRIMGRSEVTTIFVILEESIEHRPSLSVRGEQNSCVKINGVDRDVMEAPAM
jgi:hypothetical protein